MPQTEQVPACSSRECDGWMTEEGLGDTAGLALVNAAASGNLTLVSSLLADGAPLEGVDGGPRTPLQAAAEGGHEEVVAALIDAGALLEAASPHEDERRALHLACLNGCDGVVRRLLTDGADIHARMRQGYTPLHEACFTGQVETVKVMIEAGADIEDSNVDGGWRPIHRAALWGWPKVIQVLLDAGADIESQTTLGLRPIHCAAMRGHVNVIKALIERGCQTYSSLQRYESTALHHAAGGGQLKTVQWLVVKGGFPHDALNGDKRTSEELAHLYGYHNVAWWLHKLNVNASPRKHKDIARVLEEHERLGDISLKWGKNGERKLISDQVPFRPWRIHYQDPQGWTPLHHAAFNNQRPTVEALLSLGALPLSFNYKQETPADLAHSRDYTDLAQLLNPTPTHQTLSGKVALYEQLLTAISLAENQTETNMSDQEEKSLRLICVRKVSGLVMNGAPLQPVGGHIIYPLHLAISSNRIDLLPLLLCAGAPLTSTACGLSVLKQAWFTKDVTTNVGVVITRALIHTLQFERDQILFDKPEDNTCQRLLDGISHLIRSMKGNQPWDATWPDSQENAGETARSSLKISDAASSQSSIHPERNYGNDDNDGRAKTLNICGRADSNEEDVISDAGYWKELTVLLDQACKLGITLTASFIKRRGGSVSWCGGSGRTALHTALDAGRWTTAVALVRDMGANIFLQDCHGRFPLDLCPQDLKTQLLQDALSHDYRYLDHLLSKTHQVSEKRSTIHVMLLFAALYVNSTGSCTTVTTNSGTGSDQGSETAALESITNSGTSRDLSTADYWERHTTVITNRGTGRDQGTDTAAHHSATNNSTGRNQGTETEALHSTTDCWAISHNWQPVFVYLVSVLQEWKEDDFTTSAWLENLLVCLSRSKYEEQKQEADVGNREDTKEKDKDDKAVTSGGKGDDVGDTKSKRVGFRKTSTEEYMFFQLVDMLSQVKLHEKRCSARNVEIQQTIKTTVIRALFIACRSGLTTLLHLLLTVAGVGIDSVVEDVSGSTALHVAASQGRPGLCDFLLSGQASAAMLDRAGRTPAHLAYMFGHSSTGDRLVAGVEHVTDKAKNSPRKLLEGFMKYNATYMLNNNISILSHEQNDETSLIRAHLNHFKQRWRGSIEEAVRKLHVDFTKGEAREVKEVVTREMTRILEKLEKVNPMFASRLHVLGSSADNLKLYAPDEFHFNVVLKNISGFHGGGLRVNLQHLSRKEAEEKGYNFSLRVMSTKDELKTLVTSKNFVNMFFEALSGCVRIFEPSDPRLGFVVPGVRQTKVGANVSFAWEGSEFPLLLIDVDLVPVVEVPWPQQLDRPPLTPPWVSSIHISNAEDDSWRYFFASVENLIFRELPVQRRLVLLACRLLVTTLKVKTWAPKDIKEQHTYWIGHRFKIPAPEGFIIKSSFLREMEEVKDDSLWEAPHVLQRIKSVFQRMCKFEGSSSNSENKQKYHLSQVKAYFGGECEKPTVGYSAPEILCFLEAW